MPGQFDSTAFKDCPIQSWIVNLFYAMTNASPNVNQGAKRYALWNSFNTAVICLGLIGAVAYFLFNTSLPESARGLLCCDAAAYLRLSDGGLWNVFVHSSLRVFGYPFYLAVFRELFRGYGDFLMPALIFQLILHLGSCAFLFYAIRLSELRVPLVALALLFVHPALTGVSALTLTDSLSTSILSSIFALIILLLYGETRTIAKSVLIGALFGALLTLRPSTSTLMIPAVAIICSCVFALTYQRIKLFKVALVRATLCCLAMFLGYLPTYGHTIHNCYSSHHEWCVIPAHEVRGNVPRSFLFAIQFSRFWGIISPQGLPEFRRTEDVILTDCTISEESGTSDLLSCYLKNKSRLPRHFFRRILGVFDNRHLNPYAALSTSPSEYWAIRSFSIVGLIGLVAALGIVGASFRVGGLARQGHILLALVFLAIQINFHTENRYVFPIVPLLFLLGIGSIATNPFPKRWHHIAFLIVALALVTVFTTTVIEWDAREA